MGRIRQDVVVRGRKRWTLFDTGARNTYVIEDVAKDLPVFKIEHSEPVSLGGKMHHVTENCWLECMIDGLPVRSHARVLDAIGPDENGTNIEILIGALTMQEWGIRPVPDEEKLDMGHYPKEFVEFRES
ncbi:MAG: hypothetical protein HY748_14630 [Elusimicrobia bacterium]|nr:hypothetical protein [Elusimicrobiota bacterium]